MQRRLFLGNLLKPLGVLTTACAATPVLSQTAPVATPASTPAPTPAQPASTTPSAVTKRIDQSVLNPLAVAQASFHRMFKDESLKLENFPEFVSTKCGLSRVQWFAPLLPGINEESAKKLSTACQANNVRSLLFDPLSGPGFASVDASVRAAALEKLKSWCAIANTLSCSGIAIDLRGEGTYEEQLPRAVAGANMAFQVAHDAGLPLVAQSLGGLTSNATFMAALMEQLQNAAIRLEPSFDSWKVTDTDTFNRMRGLGLLIPYAASILADYMAFLPSGDSVNFKTDYLMRQIRESTFRGPVTILYKGPADALEGVLSAKKILIKYKCLA